MQDENTKSCHLLTAKPTYAEAGIPFAKVLPFVPNLPVSHIPPLSELYLLLAAFIFLLFSNLIVCSLPVIVRLIYDVRDKRIIAWPVWGVEGS